MREHEKVIASALLLLLLVTWFVFLVHEDPRFAGSPLGGLFGVLGLLVMLVAYLYPAVKRVAGLRRAVSKTMSLGTFLELHVFAGILGPLLGLVADVREKKAMLAALEQEYHHLSLEVAGSAGRGGLLARVSGVSEAIADVEYALATDERARRLFARWLAVHIALSLALLALLGLHVFSSFYYGVRWLGG